MSYKEEARQLVRSLNQRMGPSPYDIAWLARLGDPSNGRDRWPDLIEWLLENQHPDGSWGGKIVYYHDRIICTLAAAIALHERGNGEASREAVRQAELYLWRHLHLLPHDPYELVGFELIFPTLLAEARALGMDVPTHTCGYGEMQTEKLRLIPPDMLYSREISAVHSLEFLGQAADPERLKGALSGNGSLGNSPAATAYYLRLLHGDDEKALEYLEMVREQSGHFVCLYPFSVFELAWVLHNLSFSGVPVTEFADQGIWNRLQSEMTSAGVGLDATFGVPDADCTSVCAYLLVTAGYNVDPSVLSQFEDQEKHMIRTYRYERNPSVSTNAHALEALKVLEDYPNRRYVREEIIFMLLASRRYNLYWTDKWHSSPYYATAHALMGLLGEGAYLTNACRQTVDWIVHTQGDDGAWGFYQIGTAEETAYALSALLHYSRYEPIDQDVLHRGAAYLAREHAKHDSAYPELWLGKDLYVPHDVVRSAILSALILYTETFGRSP